MTGLTHSAERICLAGKSSQIQPTTAEIGDVKEKEKTQLVAPKTKNKRPPFFKVVMLNDDFTPMDFVVDILKSVFRKNHEDAISTMLQIHQKGSATCGVYTRDVAETKAEIVVNCARKNEFPLQCVVEEE